jgi:hypothetical protein
MSEPLEEKPKPNEETKEKQKNEAIPGELTEEQLDKTAAGANPLFRVQNY